MLTRTKVTLAAIALILLAISAAQSAGQFYMADIIFKWLNR
jgi:hypothetical protein